MKKHELAGKTRQQLLALAGKAGVRGRHRMTREALRQSLETAIETAPEPPPASPAELPASYGKTRLVLMEIEPYKLHAYWEVTPKDLRSATARLGRQAVTATWTLRFYDVTCLQFDGANAHSYFDVPVEAGARNWYVDLWASEKTYCAELGLRAATGQFRSVCRSNFVQTPRHEPSPKFDPAWARVQGQHVEPVPAPAGSAADRPAPAEPAEADDATAAKIREHHAALMASGEPNRQAGGSSHAPPAAAEPAVGSSRWTSLTVETPGSADSGSGGSLFPPAGPAAIDLQLNAEVVVYGRAQPGQALQINGHWVTVNPDGTFRVQWAVPVQEIRDPKPEIRNQTE